jgi:hypothetical protein
MFVEYWLFWIKKPDKYITFTHVIAPHFCKFISYWNKDGAITQFSHYNMEGGI